MHEPCLQPNVTFVVGWMLTEIMRESQMFTSRSTYRCCVMDSRVVRMDSHLIQRNVVTDHAAEAVDEARQSDCPWCIAVSVDLVARV